MKNLNTPTIVNALHSAHEKIEDLINQKKRLSEELAKKNSQLELILGSLPEYCNYRELEASEFEDESGAENLRLLFKDLVINQTFLDEFSARFLISQDKTRMFFSYNQKKAKGLSFVSASESGSMKELLCSFDRNQPEATERLSDLSTSEWMTLLALMKMLKNIFLAPPKQMSSKNFDYTALASEIADQIQNYENWPSTLRYDELTIEKITHGDVYHSLALKLTKLSILNTTHNEISFVLSTVDDGTKSFGSNPRLEFLETTQSIFENWDKALATEQDRKFELRFAAPNAIDIKVWGALSSKDKILVAGLIGKLPSMINQLASSVPHMSMRWLDWQTLAATVKNIFIQNMVVQQQSVRRKQTAALK